LKKILSEKQKKEKRKLTNHDYYYRRGRFLAMWKRKLGLTKGKNKRYNGGRK